METKRLTAAEREALLRMNVAAEILTKEPDHMIDRVRMVPYAKRDMAMMSSKIRKLLIAFRDTIPENQLSTYEHSLRMSSFVVGAKRPGTLGERNGQDFGMWIPFDVLNMILYGCRDHCTMCNLDKGMRKACELRKALDVIPNDVPRNGDDCPYFTL